MYSSIIICDTVTVVGLTNLADPTIDGSTRKYFDSPVAVWMQMAANTISYWIGYKSHDGSVLVI